MAEITFDSDKLDETLAAVSAELTEMLKAEQDALRKSAKDDEPGEASQGSSGPTEPDHEETPGESAPPEASASPAPAPGPGPEASASAAPAPEASASAPAADPAAAAGGEQPPTVEELQQAYAALPPDQQKMHFLALKSVLMQQMGGQEQSAPGALPPAAPPPGPEASAPAPQPMMGKAEMKAKQLPDNPANTGESVPEKGKMSKSEEQTRIEALEAKLAEQQTEMKKQESAFAELCETIAKPIRKSVKGVSDLKFIERTEEPKPAPKAATMTRPQIQAALSEKVREGKLSKSDKEKILSFNCGNAELKDIEHILSDVK